MAEAKARLKRVVSLNARLAEQTWEQLYGPGAGGPLRDTRELPRLARPRVSN